MECVNAILATSMTTEPPHAKIVQLSSVDAKIAKIEDPVQLVVVDCIRMPAQPYVLAAHQLA